MSSSDSDPQGLELSLKGFPHPLHHRYSSRCVKSVTRMQRPLHYITVYGDWSLREDPVGLSAYVLVWIFVHYAPKQNKLKAYC